MNPQPTAGDREPNTLEQPAPTVWPMVAALGVTLMCGGLVTHVAVSAVGVVLAIMGAVGCMCPCHGGVYYEDGSRASGPPPRGLFRYEYQIREGQLWVRGGQISTLSEPV